MEKLQWFKFTPSDWMMGKIQRCPEITQARFIRLCCLYWNKESNLLRDDAIIEIDQEHYDILLRKKIITDDGAHVFIKFLNEQLEAITETSKGKSKAAKVRWEKHKKDKASAMQNDADAMHMHTDAMQNDAEKRREEKRREENINKPTAFSFFHSLKSLGVDENLINDWLKVRKTKKCVNTKTAFEAFVKELNKTKLTPNDVVKLCCEKSWGGFNFEWLNVKDVSNVNPSNPTNDPFVDKVRAEIAMYAELNKES